MAYCVFTCKKPKTGAADGGLSAHIDREKWDDRQHRMVPFVPKSVIHPELSHLNREYLLPPGTGRSEAIERRIREAGITRKIRADQAKFLAFVCSSDHETMQRIYDEGRFEDWVSANISFMKKTFGEENVVGCAAHMDEVSFHIHFTVVPIVMGQAAEHPDTRKQYEERNGKEKRRYRKQEVTARLCARDVFTQASAERWQTDYALHMQAAGFDLQRGVEGSRARHMDPAAYNAIKAEEAMLEAERAGLEMQKDVLTDEVGSLHEEKQSLELDIETLRKEMKQADKAIKSLHTMCTNLTAQKSRLSADLYSLQKELSDGRISLADFDRHRSDIERQISECDSKLADKQQKLEAKNAELKEITDRVNFYDVAHVRFDVPEIKVRVPKVTERPPRFGNIDEWMATQNAGIREQFRESLNTYGKTVMDAARKSIVGERKSWLMKQRDMEELGDSYRQERYLRLQQAKDVQELLELFENPDTAGVAREVAIALMGGGMSASPVPAAVL
ncbi:MAG: MobV family relaxase [Bacteroidales bacterium]|nr:MobV family relaxase [Bacteroidales bacterium]